MSYIKDREFCNLQKEVQEERDAKTGDTSIFQTKQSHSPNRSFLLPHISSSYPSEAGISLLQGGNLREGTTEKAARPTTLQYGVGHECFLFVRAAPSLSE